MTEIQEWTLAAVSASCASPVINGVARGVRAVPAMQLRCRATVALAGIPPARPDSMARCEGSFYPLPGVELVVGGWVAGGLGRRVDPGSRMDPPECRCY